MFGRDKTTRNEHDATRNQYDRGVRERTITARGGVSPGTILTGALVAIGAFFLLSSVVGAILSATGVTTEELASGDAVDAGIAGGVALLASWFLSFTWGGYTAGRMGRGSGFFNGLLVPIGVILLAAIVGGIAWALGASEGWTLPSPTRQIQVEGQFTSVDYEVGLIAVTLGVMFLGSVVGGIFGARWHTKLERRVETERHEQLVGERTEREVDLRDRDADNTAGRTPAVTTANLNNGPATDRTATSSQYPTAEQPPSSTPPPAR